MRNARMYGGKLVVEVEDLGETSMQQTSADLLSVTDRVRALDGRMTVESGPAAAS